MSVSKNSTSSYDLGKEEEYHFEEMDYHFKCFEESMKEALYHLQKSRQHEMELQEVKSRLKWED